MTNEELADQLNTQLALTAADALTVHVIRQWVSWGVLPRATGHGRQIGASRVWSRDDTGLRQALRLAELRSLGLKSRQAVVSQLWLEGWPIEFRVVRPALVAKFTATSKRILRRLTTDYDPRIYPNPTTAKQRAVVNQIGPLAPIFENSPFTLTELEKMTAYGSMRFGQEIGQAFESIAARIFKLAAPNFELPNGELALTDLTGIFGDPKEIEGSARESLAEAGQPEYDLARRCWRLERRVWSIASAPEFEKFAGVISQDFFNMLSIFGVLKDQIFIGDWALSRFALRLHDIHRRPNIFLNLLEIVERGESELNMLEKHFEIPEISEK